MTEYKTETLEHLGLVSLMIDELGIVESIDNAIEQDKQERKVTIGEAVKAMILNGLGFVNRQLYLVPQFFENKPLELLIRKGIEPNNLNDTVLAKTKRQKAKRGLVITITYHLKLKLINIDKKVIIHKIYVKTI